MSKLTHFDEGGAAHMVDVGPKPESERVAVASGAVEMAADTLRAIREGSVGKGDVLGIARVAGITATKKTSELIPLCHPVRVTAVNIQFSFEDSRVAIRAEVQAFDRTGVEMEALTAVATAALTIYDMCKSMDRAMRVVAVQLEEKRGGKSGAWTRSR